jgi:hypothetical protein
MLYSLAHRGASPISRFAANRDPDLDPDFRSRPFKFGKRGFPEHFPVRVPAESGNGDSLPVSRPNREWGERELGIPGHGRAGSQLAGDCSILGD